MPIRLRPLALAAAATFLLAVPARAQNGFVVEYPPVQGADAARQREWLMQTRQMEMLAQGLNSWIRMPRRVPVRMLECTSSDIRWNAEEHAVEMCYRMLTRLYGIAAGQDSLRPAVGGAHLFMTLHGVAHAIVDELDLPAGADPEATVDEISALLFISSRSEEIPIFVVGGISAIQRADPRWSEWAYATAHGLGPERFQNVACLVYGANPDRFGALRREGLLPAGAQQRCRAAGTRMLEVWGRRLGRYLR